VLTKEAFLCMISGEPVPRRGNNDGDVILAINKTGDPYRRSTRHAQLLRPSSVIQQVE
jgi:hypothetical protein